ncbi:M3 family oligoendopeptidase [Spiroplasma endosymbiont of Asaphidion curtum]|uniref:M3 family oligoendopeptidase n=1 Tax=Spiroplasma endosymbiont of Asaphidion curtum TaxID=3066281 RepID=UPI00313C47B5
MKRINADKKYQWDLSYLFTSDDEWTKTLQNYINHYGKLYNLKGKLHQQENFKQYILLSEAGEILGAKLSQYLHYGSLDTTDERFINLSNLMMNESLKIQTKMSFVEPELKQIGAEKIMQMLASDSELANFEYDFRSFFEKVKYLLTEEQEELLNNVAKTRSTSYQLYDLLAYADKEKQYLDYDGKKQELTESLATSIAQLSRPKEDQKLRREASMLLNKHLITKKYSLAKVYEDIIQFSVEEVKLRNYESSLQASLLGDKVLPDMYLTLLEVGKEYIHLYRLFIKIKQKYFQLDKFYATDSHLLMNKTENNKYSVMQGIAMVKAAFQPLGEEYLTMLDIALLPGRIDYFEDTNKRSGAYSSSGKGVEPIILMNWDDSLRTVATLAHELGHSVHTLFSNKYQPPNLAQYPIILAEVASTFNEHLLFKYLYTQAKEKDEQIYLLETRINDLMATFFRQIQFAKFELEAHKLVEQEQPINASILAKLFKDISIEYGYDVYDEIADDAIYAWSRILHFFNSPYYVYKYATSVTTSFKLYDDFEKGNKANILNFLKAGGHKEPMLILQDVGIDLALKATYVPLMEHLEQLLDELEKLLQI